VLRQTVRKVLTFFRPTAGRHVPDWRFRKTIARPIAQPRQTSASNALLEKAFTQPSALLSPILANLNYLGDCPGAHFNCKHAKQHFNGETSQRLQPTTKSPRPRGQCRNQGQPEEAGQTELDWGVVVEIHGNKRPFVPL
jgi:hypothetical protein